jgi:hypothetical protein
MTIFLVGLIVILPIIAYFVGIAIGESIANRWFEASRQVVRYVTGTTVAVSIAASGVVYSTNQIDLNAQKENTNKFSLSTYGTTVTRSDVLFISNRDTLKWYVEKDGGVVLERAASKEESFDIVQVFSEPGEYTITLYIVQGKKGSGEYVPVSNQVNITIQPQTKKIRISLTNKNCKTEDFYLDGKLLTSIEPGSTIAFTTTEGKHTTKACAHGTSNCSGSTYNWSVSTTDSISRNSSCDVAQNPEPAQNPNPEPAQQPAPKPTYPTLYANQNYLCREGPGKSYEHVADIYKGTSYRIIGLASNGWYAIAISFSNTSHTYCWIGGGDVSGDLSTVKYYEVQPPSTGSGNNSGDSEVNVSLYCMRNNNLKQCGSFAGTCAELTHGNSNTYNGNTIWVYSTSPETMYFFHNEAHKVCPAYYK